MQIRIGRTAIRFLYSFLIRSMIIHQKTCFVFAVCNTHSHTYTYMIWQSYGIEFPLINSMSNTCDINNGTWLQSQNIYKLTCIRLQRLQHSLSKSIFAYSYRHSQIIYNPLKAYQSTKIRRKQKFVLYAQNMYMTLFVSWSVVHTRNIAFNIHKPLFIHNIINTSLTSKSMQNLSIISWIVHFQAHSQISSVRASLSFSSCVVQYLYVLMWA